MNGLEKLNTFREYTIIQQLRVSAGQSDIYAVRKTEGGDDLPYLLKIYGHGAKVPEQILGQIMALGGDPSENLIRMYDCGFDEDAGRYFEVQEFIRYGSLNRLIAVMNEGNRDFVMKSVIEQILNGLKILHDNNILHLDLKPSNILIKSDKPFKIVLTDFGLSSVLDRETSWVQSQVKGTNNYQAPEVYLGSYHKKTDYWAFGIIIYELLLGENPFKGKKPPEVMNIVTNQKIEISDKIDKKYISLLKGLLTKEVTSRWGYDEVSRWLAGEIVAYESETRFKTPYKFNKTEYYTIEELFRAFNESELTKQMAKVHLSEGFLIKWLKDEKDFDTIAEIKTVLNTYQGNVDYALMKLLENYKFTEKQNKINPKKSIEDNFDEIDINRKGSDGETKLIKAVINRQKDLVKKLLDNGSDPRIEDNYGWTALMWAEDKKFVEIIELLKNNLKKYARDKNPLIVKKSNDNESGEKESSAVPFSTVSKQTQNSRIEMSVQSVKREPAAGDLLSVSLNGGVSIVLVWVPPGTFKMGSPEDEKDRFSNEKFHAVTITKGYWLGKYPVTQGQWQKVMINNPSKFKKGDNYPVESVSWNDCQEFINELNDLVKKINALPQKSGAFRLPTEAEWEYACRAGTQTRFYWDDDLDEKEIGRYCWCYSNSDNSTHSVGQKKPNKFGLYDMSGNVFEWCNDWYGDYPSDAVTDPTGAKVSLNRVNRGGGWTNYGVSCRSASRRCSHLLCMSADLGFRLVLSSTH